MRSAPHPDPRPSFWSTTYTTQRLPPLSTKYHKGGGGCMPQTDLPNMLQNRTQDRRSSVRRWQGRYRNNGVPRSSTGLASENHENRRSALAMPLPKTCPFLYFGGSKPGDNYPRGIIRIFLGDNELVPLLPRGNKQAFQKFLCLYYLKVIIIAYLFFLLIKHHFIRSVPQWNRTDCDTPTEAIMDQNKIRFCYSFMIFLFILVA
jgi:hypothetical protein